MVRPAAIGDAGQTNVSSGLGVKIQARRLAGRRERRDLRLTGGDVGKFASPVVAGQPFTTGLKLRAAVARASPLSRPPAQNGHPWSAPPSDGAAP